MFTNENKNSLIIIMNYCSRKFLENLEENLMYLVLLVDKTVARHLLNFLLETYIYTPKYY